MRPIIAVIGNRDATAAQCEFAEQIGRLLVERGFRVLTGGLGGVMEAASRGARSASNWREGDVIGILPGSSTGAANPYVDIVIPSGMGYARNVLIIQTAQALVAVGGGAGTLSEVALAWQSDKPIVALSVPELVQGVSGEFAGRALDARRRPPVLGATTAEEAVRLVELAVSELS